MIDSMGVIPFNALPIGGRRIVEIVCEGRGAIIKSDVEIDGILGCDTRILFFGFFVPLTYCSQSQ